MNNLECMATSCAHNHRCKCCCGNVKMSAKAGGARCNSFDDSPQAKAKSDTEFGQSIDSEITCSAQSCAFNVHYSCKAGLVKVTEDNKACKSYYGL